MVNILLDHEYFCSVVWKYYELWEDNSMAKHLPHKHENGSWIPKLDVVTHIYNPRMSIMRWEAEIGESLKTGICNTEQEVILP